MRWSQRAGFVVKVRFLDITKLDTGSHPWPEKHKDYPQNQRQAHCEYSTYCEVDEKRHGEPPRFSLPLFLVHGACQERYDNRKSMEIN